MSPEVIQIIKGHYKSELEIQISFQCAPLLAGIKISNLLNIQPQYKKQTMELFNGTKILFRILFESDKRIIFLLFHESSLKAYLDQDSVQKMLRKVGYRSCDMEDVLQEFQGRYNEYIIRKKDFPHEMGLLLGYPVEDVRGFIEQKGKNYLSIGNWKVYSNLESTLSLFSEYKRVQEEYVISVANGMSIQQIIKKNNI